MRRIIQKTYPVQFSIAILLLMFVITFLLSHQVFKVSALSLKQNRDVYFGMFLVSTAVLNMVLIMWEEILFPIKLKEVDGGVLFRNHRTKLTVQVLIYCTIPAIFGFVYWEYEVNTMRFFIWAGVCMILPVLDKIVSGINNYNDFLKLTDATIEYKNNRKEGSYKTQDIQHITIIKDEGQFIEKIQLVLKNNDQITIDVDQMELDVFCNAINEYILIHYKHLLK